MQNNPYKQDFQSWLKYGPQGLKGKGQGPGSGPEEPEVEEVGRPEPTPAFTNLPKGGLPKRRLW